MLNAESCGCRTTRCYVSVHSKTLFGVCSPAAKRWSFLNHFPYTFLKQSRSAPRDSCIDSSLQDFTRNFLVIGLKYVSCGRRWSCRALCRNKVGIRRAHLELRSNSAFVERVVSRIDVASTLHLDSEIRIYNLVFCMDLKTYSVRRKHVHFSFP